MQPQRCPSIEPEDVGVGTTATTAKSTSTDSDAVSCTCEPCNGGGGGGGGKIVATVRVNEDEEEAMNQVLKSVNENSILAELQEEGGCYGDANKLKANCRTFENIGGDPNHDYRATDEGSSGNGALKIMGFIWSGLLLIVLLLGPV